MKRADRNDMDNINFKEYLKQPLLCKCGRIHKCGIDQIIIEENALERLPEILQQYSYHNICVIEDINTEKAAGKRVCELLEGMSAVFKKICFPDPFLIPEEAALGKIMMEIDRESDLIIAVGSGTLNDICKFMSFQFKIDYFIIATAPSMDGYASNVAPLITNHAKITYEVGMPKVILGDVGILSQAPMKMIAAGVGDVLGKYVCLMDWTLAHIVNGEYHCPQVEAIVRMSIEKVMAGVDNLPARDMQAVKSVMEGLVLSGIAMSYIGNSRPASGSEHHISHYWEMMALLNNEPMELHGTKVAIGTIIGLKMYELLQTVEFDKIPVKAEYDEIAWKKEIAHIYGMAAGSVTALEDICHKNCTDNVNKRRSAFEAGRDAIMNEVAELPKAEQIIGILQSLDASYLPAQVEVDEETLRDSIFYAKDLRNRYGILQLLYDYDLQEFICSEIIDYFRSF